MKRLFTILPVAALVAMSLTSCSSDQASLATNLSPEGCVLAGPASEAIVLAGDFGGDVALTSATPVKSAGLERTVVINGDGPELTDDDDFVVSISMFNGKNGDQIAKFNDTMQLQGYYHEAILQSLQCSHIGDRVVMTMPASELYGEGQVEYAGIPDLAEGDNVVVVFDFLEIVEVLDQAQGKEIELGPDAPKVTVAANGEPTITIPDGLVAPDKLTIYTMVEGDGRVVEESDQVTVHYRGVIWRTGEEFDSSWSRSEPTKFAVDGVIDGFKKALVGHTVGSRVLTIVPANDGGYGPDQLKAQGHQPDDVMVFVLDILAAS